MQYRRVFIPGGSYFFTVVTEKRRPVFNNAAMVEVLRDAFRNVRKSRPFEIDAMVVMPDHLHCLWTLPPGDSDYATRWRMIKTRFTKHCDPAMRRYATKPIFSAMSITSITTRSNTVWRHRQSIGRIPVFAAMLKQAHIRPIGGETALITKV